LSSKRANVLFVVLAYVLFWVWIIAAGVCQMLGGAGAFDVAQQLAYYIGPWAPTFALLIMFKKLYPEWTIKEFYQEAFNVRVNFKLLAVFTIVWVLIYVGVVGIDAAAKGVSFTGLFSFSFLGFIGSLFTGDIGEESGWRGHLQQFFEKKNNVIKASLIVGIIWAFWHFPLYLLAGITGSDLILFILFNVLDKLALAMVIGICYSRCRNLFVPIWIHFISNMVLNPTQDVLLNPISNFYFIVILEVLVAAGYVVWYKKSGKNGTCAI